VHQIGFLIRFFLNVLDAAQQITKARDGLRGEVATLAVKGAEQILKREVNASAHADLLNQLKAEL